MGMRFQPKTRKVIYRDSTNKVTVEGDLTVTGTLTSNSFTLPDNTGVAGNFTVAQNLTITGTSALNGNTAVTGSLTVSGALTVGAITVSDNVIISSAVSPRFQTTDTTNTVVTKMESNDTAGVLGATSNHPISLITNNIERIGVAAAGLVTVSASLSMTAAATPTLTITDSTNGVALVAKSDDTKSTVGTSSNHPLSIITNNVERMSVAAAGTITVVGDTLATGVLSKLGINGGSVDIKVATGNKTTNSGTASETIASAIPAGAVVLAVNARVTTALSGVGLTTWSFGINGGNTTAFGTALSKNVNTTVSRVDLTANPTTLWAATAQTLKLTAAAGQFDAGVLEWEVFYIDNTAPTS